MRYIVVIITLILLVGSVAADTSDLNDDSSQLKILNEMYTGKFLIIKDKNIIFQIDNYHLLPCTSSISCDEFEVYLDKEINNKTFENTSQLSSFISYILLEEYKRRSTESTILTFTTDEKEIVPASFYQNHIGTLYFYGIGIKKNHPEGLKWYRLAANNGSSDAQFELSVFYRDGNWVEQDDKVSFKWNLKAAKQGLSKAQYNLGVKYERGYGVVIDTKEAVKWYLKAAKQGLPKAQYNLAVQYYNDENDIKAYQWFLLYNLNSNSTLISQKDVEKKLKNISNFLNEEQINLAKKVAARCMVSKYEDCD